MYLIHTFVVVLIALITLQSGKMKNESCSFECMLTAPLCLDPEVVCLLYTLFKTYSRSTECMSLTCLSHFLSTYNMYVSCYFINSNQCVY